MEREVRGQDDFLLMGSQDGSAVMAMLKMILKGWNNSSWRLAFQKQVTVTVATRVGKHGNFILKKQKQNQMGQV